MMSKSLEGSSATNGIRTLFQVNATHRPKRVGEFLPIALLALALAASVSGCALTSGGNAPPAPTQGTLAANPLSVTFGSVAVGSTTTQSALLSNTGNADVTVSQATISTKNFNLMGMTFPMTVAAGQIVPVQIQFAPEQAGNLTGTMTVTSNASDASVSVTLDGTGTQPGLTLTPSTLAFGSVSVGGTATENATLTNSGNASLTITAASPSGSSEFGMSGLTLPLTLAPNQSSSFPVQFAPTAGGSVSGSISFVSNAPGSPTVLSLSGSGETAGSALNASPSSIAFGNVVIGNHPSQTVTLKNTGTTSISVSQVAASGSATFTVGGFSPVTLTGGQTTSFTVTFTPTAAGAVSGSVTVTSTATNSSISIALSGTGTTPQPALGISPTSVSFGSVPVGTTASQSVTLSNTGSAALTISGVSASAGFSASGLTFPTTLNPGQNATLTVSFTPTAAGNDSGTLSVSSNAPGSPATIVLSGTGAQGTLSASPASVAFGSVVVSGSDPQLVTLTNTGTVAVTVSKVSASGTGFTLSGVTTTPFTMNAGATSTFTITFAPTTAGSASGSVSVTSNASNSTLVISLSGTAIQPQLSAAPADVTFGNVVTGNDPSQTVTLTNSGTASVTITQATISPSSTAFSLSGLTLPLTINAGKTSTFTVAFDPTSNGAASASISLTSNAPNSPLAIPVSGTGVTSTLQLTVNPTTLNLGNVQVGNTGTQGATLTNSGNASVTINQMTVSGSSAYTAAGVSPNQVLTAGRAVPITVTFTPTATGSATGTVTITSNATNSPTTITLNGGSHLVDLSWTASTSTVVGYNIYRGTVSGGPYAVKLNPSPVAGTTFTDTTVQAGQAYFYVVTAVDSSGTESVDSNQASATVPTP